MSKKSVLGHIFIKLLHLSKSNHLLYTYVHDAVANQVILPGDVAPDTTDGFDI